MGLGCYAYATTTLKQGAWQCRSTDEITIGVEACRTSALMTIGRALARQEPLTLRRYLK